MQKTALFYLQNCNCESFQKIPKFGDFFRKTQKTMHPKKIPCIKKVLKLP